MCGYDIACMYQSVECTCRLREVTVVAVIVGSDPIQDQIETIAKIGNAGSKSVQIKSIFDVTAFYFTKHFVSPQSTKPIHKKK
jgi:hypothetical protein